MREHAVSQLSPRSPKIQPAVSTLVSSDAVSAAERGAIEADAAERRTEIAMKVATEIAVRGEPIPHNGTVTFSARPLLRLIVTACVCVCV